MPPLQISNSVATHVSHANRFNHFVDFRTTENTTEPTDETNMCRKLLKLDCFGATLGRAKGSHELMFSIYHRTQIIRRATAAVLSAALVTGTYAAVIPVGSKFF